MLSIPRPPTSATIRTWALGQKSNMGARVVAEFNSQWNEGYASMLAKDARKELSDKMVISAILEMRAQALANMEFILLNGIDHCPAERKHLGMQGGMIKAFEEISTKRGLETGAAKTMAQSQFDSDMQKYIHDREVNDHITTIWPEGDEYFGRYYALRVQSITKDLERCKSTTPPTPETKLMAEIDTILLKLWKSKYSEWESSRPFELPNITELFTGKWAIPLMVGGVVVVGGIWWYGLRSRMKIQALGKLAVASGIDV
jgi:hypothetical protein